MTVGIDARFLGPQGTGLGRYVQELITNLEKTDYQNQYVVFLRKENFDQFKPKGANFQRQLADVSWYSLKEQIVLPQIFLKAKLDLLHVPHFNIPIFYPGKIVVTIHDLIKSEYAGLSATTRIAPVYFLKHFAYEAILRIALWRAKKILVPSKHIAEKLHDRLEIDEKKIKVTYEAASLNNKKQETSGKKVLEKYKIKKPYILYVGNAYPYKNLDNLLKALKLLTMNYGLRTMNLRFVNPCSRSVFYDRLAKKAKDIGLSDKVVLPGFVPDSDLTILYKEASAYVFPSLSEGFGIPGLEAMALGTPVVCSNIEVLHEVYGEAALFFDPQDPHDIAQKIAKVMTNSQNRSDLIERGKQQARKYSWRRLAQETLKVYQSVAQ